MLAILLEKGVNNPSLLAQLEMTEIKHSGC